jgi:hypothetical protein
MDTSWASHRVIVNGNSNPASLMDYFEAEEQALRARPHVLWG